MKAEAFENSFFVSFASSFERNTGAVRVFTLPRAVRSNRPDSGLNLFINDVKRIQVVEPPPLPQASVTQELERLHGLLVQGAISQTEFNGLKASLLGSRPTS